MECMQHAYFDEVRQNIEAETIQMNNPKIREEKVF